VPAKSDFSSPEANVHPKKANVHPKKANVHPKKANVHPKKANVHPKKANVHPENMCKKCNKIYKIKKYLIEHEENCKGVDELTCPRCMISFSSRQAKANHIKRNTCKPRSIIHARIPNPQNIEPANNIDTQINNIDIDTQNIDNQTNIQNQHINIYVNNYGKERTDYLDYDKMLAIFKKVYNIPTLLTKEIHFNEEFPENNNIKYHDTKNCLIKEDDEFIYKNLNVLIKELIKNKGRMMQNFAKQNKDEICFNMDIKIYEQIIQQLISLVLLTEPQEHYKEQVENIRDLINNSRMKIEEMEEELNNECKMST
jgi:hypothetical protein